MRVLVPLGKSKKYIAMVADVHSEKPDFNCKPIEGVLDSYPSLLPQQYRLWQWISDYYMSPLGDVYNAAMPAGMKSTEKFKPKMELYVELASSYRNEQALHVAVVGPTASGKTALAVALAKDLNGEVVSCDSMQVYRHMDIGTAKPTLAERQGIPHHMIDVAEPP